MQSDAYHIDETSDSKIRDQLDKENKRDLVVQYLREHCPKHEMVSGSDIDKYYGWRPGQATSIANRFYRTFETDFSDRRGRRSTIIGFHGSMR